MTPNRRSDRNYCSTHRKLKRTMSLITLRDKNRDTWISQQTEVIDIICAISNSKY